MEEIKICPKCGHINKGTSSYCTQCGANLNPEEEHLSRPPYLPSEEETQTAPSNESPSFEKTTASFLNYSQTLRRLLFSNPMPFFSGLALLGISLGELIIQFVLNQNQQPTFSFYLGIGLVALALFYLLLYLVITPLRTIYMSKHAQLDVYRISFYRDRLHYQVTLTYKGRTARNDFYIPYLSLVKVKEYKDITLLGFSIQGQLVPLCLLKDENYETEIAFFQDRIDHIRRK